MRISIRNGNDYYFADVTRVWAIKHDNGVLISCGLTVGENGFTLAMFKRLARNGQLTQVSQETWNHSGCQSGCVLRGDAECRW